MRLLALRITSSTYRGTLQGLPNLVETLRRHQAGATFLFTLGPDNTGKALNRLTEKGYFRQVRRTHGIAHYGLRSLMNGTLLPAPQIGRRGADILRGVKDSGFEVGVHGWDHYAWERRIANADAEWTAREMQRSHDRFADIFKCAPGVHAAAGWQMNAQALRLTQRLGYRYASDTRGTHPFMPVQNGEVILCPQIPTTLPTLDELVGFDGTTYDNVAETLLRQTALEPEHGHVFTARAEVEGMRQMAAFEKLLTGWREQGYSIVAMQDIADRLDRDTLPHHHVTCGSVPGRLDPVMVQGAEFLANWQIAV